MKALDKKKKKKLQPEIQQISKKLYKYFYVLSNILGEKKFFFDNSFGLVEIAHAPFIEFLNIFSFLKKTIFRIGLTEFKTILLLKKQATNIRYKKIVYVLILYETINYITIIQC